MANNFSENYAPQMVGGAIGGAVEVAGHLIGIRLIDCLRRNFSTGKQMQKGDHYMDLSRDLLQKHLQLINLREQNTIRHSYTNAQTFKEDFDNHSSSGFNRLLQSKKYKRLSKNAYKIIKKASDRAIDDRLMDQIVNATRGPGGGPENSPGTTSSLRDPFTDSHAISTLTDVAVGDLDAVEMSTYQSEDNSEGAVVMDLHGRDASTTSIVATFPTEVFSGDRTDREASQPEAPGAAATLSLHQEDGSTPRLVTAPLVNVPAQLTDGNETRTVSSATTTAIFGTPEGQ